MDSPYHYHKNKTLVVSITEKEGSLVRGELDDFQREIEDLNRSGNRIIALDMTKKRYLNSSGLGDLIRLKDSLVDRNIDLVLIGVTKNVMSLLEMVGVGDFFTIVNSENDLV
jgi:anti-anti-sigma factor